MHLISQDLLPINSSPIHPFSSPIVHSELMTVSPLTPPSWSISLGKRGRLNLHLMISTGTRTCGLWPGGWHFSFLPDCFVWRCSKTCSWQPVRPASYSIITTVSSRITSVLIARRFHRFRYSTADMSMSQTTNRYRSNTTEKKEKKKTTVPNWRER